MNPNEDSGGIDNILLDSFDLQQALDLLSDHDLLSDDDFMFKNNTPKGGEKEVVNFAANSNVNDANENSAMLEQTTFGSSFGSLDGIAKDNVVSASSSASSVMNMDILHWAGKIEQPLITLPAASEPSIESSQSNNDSDKGKKLKRIFSDVTVFSNKETEAQETAAKAGLDDNNSDNEGDDDDEDVFEYDNNADEVGTKSKNRETSSSRPNVREHSKAQREKRKGNISGLEHQARDLTDDLNNMNCQFIASLQTCRDRRQRQHRLIVAFLKLWMNDQSSNTDSGGGIEGGADVNRQRKGNAVRFASRQAQWAALFSSKESVIPNQDQTRTAVVSMLLPSTFSRFAPPMTACAYSSSAGPGAASLHGPHDSSVPPTSASKINISFNPQQGGTGTKSRRILSSLAHIIADSTSIAVMCQNISEFGPVQICHFMLGIDVPMEDFISEDFVAIAPFYMYSKNATMCGGKFEIDLKGYLHCEFSTDGMIQKIELSYDDWHFTEQLLESFGPSIYRPFSDVTFGDEDFHTAERRTVQPTQEELSGRDISMAQILHMDPNSNERVFPRVNNKHVIPKNISKNTLNDECRVITSFDPNVIVEAINQTAFEQFGSITGRSLISADWMGEALSVLSQWSPYVCTLNTVRSSPEMGAPVTETKCLLFPMFDKSLGQSGDSGMKEGEGGEGGAFSVPSPSCVPNKICWIIFNHHGNSHAKQLETIIQQFLHGSVSKFATKLNYIGSSCYFLSFMSLLSQAELILNCDSDDEDENDDGDSPMPPVNDSVKGESEKDLNDFLSMLADFLRWMSNVESKIWSEENPLLEVFFFNSTDSFEHMGQSPTRLSRSALMEMEKSANEQKPDDAFSLSRGLAPNSQALSTSFSSIISCNSSVSSRTSSRSSSISDAEEDALNSDDGEWTLFMEFLDDINNFFTMLRESHVSEHIVSLLKSISKPKDYLLLEELNAHCLTKHMNGRICFLMKHAKDLIQHQDFERAVETLSEIISLDPTFIEAYNRRATALFGLHRAQECFSDLEHVLRANPLHYGALCGKGLLSMNLKAYVPAAECFEKALEVNPMLSHDEIILRSIELCRQAVREESGQDSIGSV